MGKNLILETMAREMRTGVLVLDRKGSALYANPFFLKSFPVEGGVEGKSVSECVKSERLLKSVEVFLKNRGGA